MSSGKYPRDMRRLAGRKWLRRYLAREHLSLLPPDGGRWKYWAVLHQNGGLSETCAELLIYNAWEARKVRRFEACWRQITTFATPAWLEHALSWLSRLAGSKS